MPSFRLGKRPPVVDPRTLQFKRYRATLPTPATAIDYMTKAAPFPMFMNNQLSDCVEAAQGHMIQNWTAYAGAKVTLSDQDIETAYQQIGGYVPGDPSTDNGSDMLTALNYWRQNGVGGHKIIAFVQLTRGDLVELMEAIELFGNAFLGFALPDAVLPENEDWTQIPWIWEKKWKPNLRNGHCVPAMGYGPGDDVGSLVIGFPSWGAEMMMDGTFYEKSNAEAYAVVTQDWIEADGRSPSGFDTQQLLADLAEITA